MKPTFIGIGAQKCASTWAYRMLEEHPQICVSSVKEVDFFSYYYDRGWRWYEGHFAHCGAQPIVGEISPSYFHDLAAPSRAARWLPEARIVLTLRDPVERAFSNYLHDLRLGFLKDPALAFDQALNNNPMYIEQGNYAEHLRRWLDYFPMERVLVLFQENIAADAGAECRRLYAFLGADAAFVPPSLHSKDNASYVPRNRVLDSAIDKVNTVAERLGLQSVLDAARRLPAYQRLKAWQRQPARSVVPPISDETRQRLRTIYEPQKRELERMLNVKISNWRSFVDVR